MSARGRGMFSIGAVAELTGIHQQTIRHYERLGLLTPRRSPGGTRYFSQQDVERLQEINTLTQDLGVNLAGVEIILKMRGREDQLLRLLKRILINVDDEQLRRLHEEFGAGEPGLVQVQRQRLAVIRESVTREVRDKGRGGG